MRLKLKRVTEDENGDDIHCEALYQDCLSEAKEVVSLKDATKMLNIVDWLLRIQFLLKHWRNKDQVIFNCKSGSVSPAVDLSDV